MRRRVLRCSDRTGPRAAAAAITVWALAAVGLPGCGATPTATRPAPAPARHAAAGVDHDAYAALGFRLAWRGYAVMGRGGTLLHATLAEDGVLVHSTNHILTYMDLATGANRWSTTVGSPIDTFVGDAVVDDRVYAASDNELFLLDRATGAVRDRQRLAVVVSTAPRIFGPVAVFGSGSGEVLGHNLLTGFKLWGYRLSGRITARPAAVGEFAGVVSQTGDTIIIDPQTGSATMRSRVFAGPGGDPVADEGAMFIASLDQSVYAFPARGSSWLWRVRTEAPVTAQPTLLDGALYVDLPSRGLTALDPATGDVRWANPDAGGTVVGVRGGDLIAHRASDGAAFRLDADTGDVIERVSLPGAAVVMMRPAVDGDLVVVSPAGVVDRFIPR
ncbi:MAG: hypothetical protein D6693_09790 [Planctomycetota bacterium]|nr:MAG: hypothetical protein D6693_09790 [Planctomycetota bacterium]